MTSTETANTLKKVSIVVTHHPTVSRIAGTTEINKFTVELDVNTEIYPMVKDALYKFVITNSLNSEGTTEIDVIQFLNEAERGQSLADQYDYVTYGKIFKYQIEGDQINIIVSFGGLLMNMSGSLKNRNLLSLEMDGHIYLLMTKV